MIIEALAQTAGILCFVTAGIFPDEKTRFYFVGIDKARFRQPVVPGDQLILEAESSARSAASGASPRAALVGENEGGLGGHDARRRRPQ